MDCLSITWWLPDNCPITALDYNCQTTVWWLPNDYLLTWRLPDNYYYLLDECCHFHHQKWPKTKNGMNKTLKMIAWNRCDGRFLLQLNLSQDDDKTKKSRCELRPFFGSHARTSHVQIKVRTHTCAHTQSEVVALRTRTRTSGNFSIFFHQIFKLFPAIFQHFYGLVCSKTE